MPGIAPWVIGIPDIAPSIPGMEPRFAGIPAVAPLVILGIEPRRMSADEVGAAGAGPPSVRP